MPKLESLIVIEEALANKLGQAWQKYAKSITDEIVELMEADKEAEAINLVRTITADEVVDDLEGQIEFLLTSALVFGALQWADDSSDIVYSKGDLPLALEVSIANFILSSKKVAGTVRTQALKVIDAYFDAQKEVVLKFPVDAVCTFHNHGPIFKTQTFVLKAPSKLAQAMAASVLGTGKAMFNAGANLATSRLVTYGGLSQASIQEDGTYQISEQLDDKSCPACEIMHGKVFEVTIARDRMESILMMDNPDDLKAAAPWPKQTKQGITDLKGMSQSDLVDNRFQNPPYHPHCRGVVVRTGSVTPLPPSLLPKPRPRVEPVPEGLKPLPGTPVTPVRPFEELLADKVPVEDLMKHPDVTKAMKEMNALPKTHLVDGYGTDDYWKNREFINRDTGRVFHGVNELFQELDDISGKYAGAGGVRIEGRLDVVLGAPAAGKSSAIAEPLASKLGARILDGDDVKRFIPEFGNGIGAAAVHVESSNILSRYIAHIIDRGENIVMPKVGGAGDVGKITKIIDRYNQKGYHSYIHLMEVITENAMSRNMFRFNATGRLVPPDFVRVTGTTPYVTFDEIVASLKTGDDELSVVQGYVRYDNNVPFKADPIVLDEKYSGVTDLFGGTGG